MSPDGFDSLGRITLDHFAEGYGGHYVTLSAENVDIDFNLEGRSESGTKHEVIDARDTRCAVEMDATEKEHEVEIDATETDHEVEIEKAEAVATGRSPLYTLLVMILIGYRCSQQLFSGYHSILFP